MSPVITNLLLKSLAETLYMLSVSAIIAALIGIPLGILLVVTEKHGILACPVLNKPLAFIINLIRSIPFIILMVAIIPFTRLVAGTSIGTTAAIVPLTIAAIPYTARMVETSIREIPFGLIEAAESMGASPLQIIWKVLIPEALPSIIESLTVVIVSLIGASAMAMKIAVSRVTLYRDVSLSFGVAVVLFLMGRDGELSRVEGVLLLVVFAIF